MKRLAQGLGGVLFTVVVMLSSVTRPVLADSYSVVNLGNDNGHSIYGIDTAGDVVVWGTSGCGVTSPTCYVTYINGVATSDSATAPVLAYDNQHDIGIEKPFCDFVKRNTYFFDVPKNVRRSEPGLEKICNSAGGKRIVLISVTDEHTFFGHTVILS